MPTPTVANGVEVVQTFLQGNGDVCVNVYHYTGSGTVTAAAASAINDAFDTAWSGSTLKGVTANDSKWVKLQVKRMDAAPWFVWDFDHLSSGSDTGNLLPAQIAVCATLRTAAAGRSGRGRIYFGNMTESSSTVDGAVEAATASILGDWIDAIKHIVAGALTFDLAVYSRVLNGLNVVTSHSVNSRFDVQRRRANRRI